MEPIISGDGSLYRLHKMSALRDEAVHNIFSKLSSSITSAEATTMLGMSEECTQINFERPLTEI